MTLEQLARANGVLTSDRTRPCLPSHDSSPSAVFSNMANSSPFSPFGSLPVESDQCVFPILGREINTASFALYVFSVSVFFQALLIVSISGAADHGKWRRTLLVLTACAGSTATMLFVTVTPNHILYAAVLAIIANTCFGASFVLLNSFLPLLARNHRDVRTFTEDIQSSAIQLPATVSRSDDRDGPDIDDDTDTDRYPDYNAETDALLPNADPQSPLQSTPAMSKSSLELSISTKISSTGIGIGYGAAIIVQLTCILVVVLLRRLDPLWGLRFSLLIIGAWWFIFTIPATARLQSRPGPPLSLPFALSRNQYHKTRMARVLHRLRIAWAYITVSWRSLFRTICLAGRLRDLVVFLGAWFLLSDGIATTSGTAILFAKTSLKMSSPAVATVSVLSTVSGFGGAFLWPRISRAAGWSPSQTMLACNIIFALIPLYGILGFVPAITRIGFGGLQTPMEVYALAILYGFQLGGISVYCRAIFSGLIPPGSEAAFFALHAITDKGSSVIGPAIVGAITNKFGAIRPAFFFLAGLVLMPIPLLASVDVDRGREQAVAMASEIVGHDVTDPQTTGAGPILLSDDEEESDTELSDTESNRANKSVVTGVPDDRSNAPKLAPLYNRQASTRPGQ